MKKNRIGIIDLGTNTFHLLVAETSAKNLNILFRSHEVVKIGKGGINQNFITELGLQRALAALRTFKDKLNKLEVPHVYAFGTSALRNAINRDLVCEKIKTETGIEVTLITGDQEAAYIYHGVNAALTLGEEKTLIMDIGGGSVEFIIGNGNQILWKKSFEVGGQRLIELFQHHDPIHPDDLNELTIYLNKNLITLLEAIQLHKPTILAGASGTFDTLSEIFCINQGIATSEEDPETPLTLQAFNEIYNDLRQKNREERLATPGMVEMRVDMIVVGCALIKYILDSHPFTHIRVSTYSLKEGVLELLNKGQLT